MQGVAEQAARAAAASHDEAMMVRRVPYCA